MTSISVLRVSPVSEHAAECNCCCMSSTQRRPCTATMMTFCKVRAARPQVRVLGATMGAWGREKYGLKPVKRDCLEYWPDRLEYLREQILVKTKEARAKFVPCAFVTFRSALLQCQTVTILELANAQDVYMQLVTTGPPICQGPLHCAVALVGPMRQFNQALFRLPRSRRSQVVASTTLINHDLSVWLTKPAPSPPTVYWPNIRWRQWERSSRTLLVWIAFWALCFFYLIPIGAVQVCIGSCDHRPLAMLRPVTMRPPAALQHRRYIAAQSPLLHVLCAVPHRPS